MLLVRLMKAEDAESGARLAGQLGYPSSTAEFMNRWNGLGAGHAVFVAEEAWGMLGWIHVHENRTLCSEPRVEIGGLIVDRESRGEGIGKRLIERGEKWARERGLELMRLTSNIKREEAHEFYRKLGYESSKTSHVFSKRI